MVKFIRTSKNRLKNSFSKVFVSLVGREWARKECYLPPILSTPQKPHAWEPLSGLHGQITGEAEVEENISSLVLSWAEKKKQAYHLLVPS